MNAQAEKTLFPILSLTYRLIAIVMIMGLSLVSIACSRQPDSADSVAVTTDEGDAAGDADSAEVEVDEESAEDSEAVVDPAAAYAPKPLAQLGAPSALSPLDSSDLALAPARGASVATADAESAHSGDNRSRSDASGDSEEEDAAEDSVAEAESVEWADRTAEESVRRQRPYGERYRRPTRRYSQAPGAMYFQDYGVNPWMDTYEDNRSTFAMDVDTGSYTLARSYINEGNLPPAEAVRVEEFVNYFDQGYRAPRGETFAIHVDGSESPYGLEEGERLMRVGIQGQDISDWRREDMALTFVIDTSGSMDQENRLELVKDALLTLVDGLGSGDEVAIVAYGDQAWEVLPMTSVRQSRTIRDALRNLRPGGSTNAEAGLTLAYDIADAHYRRDAVNRVILCSDGVANVGATGPGQILDRIGNSVRRGITLTSIGVGMGNYNDVMMEQLADKGDGAYFYVDDRAEADRVFGEEITSTLQPIALNAKVQVEFDPEKVWAYRLLGYENRDVADQDFRNDRVDAGEIGAGHSVTALYALSLIPRASGEIGQVTLRYRKPEESSFVEQYKIIDAGDIDGSFEQANANFRLAASTATFAEVLRNSHYASQVSMRDLIRHADEAAVDLRSSEADELLSLMEDATYMGLAYEGRERGERPVARYRPRR
jgi:Ca-activated chloride channel family protein